MKVTLIMPRGALYRCGTGVFKRPIRYAPLTLTSLASLVPAEFNAEIEIFDEGVERIPETIKADLVGITAITGTSMRAYALADRLRRRGTTVVLGGVHPTLMPEEAMLHADSVVTGFAEESWPQLLRDFKNGTMKKRYEQSPRLSLENLPPPRRDLYDKKGYVTIHTVQATRGCVNSCDFCVVPVAWGRRMYFRPVEQVVDELRQIKSNDVLFVDVSPIEDKRYAKELFRAMIPLKKRWGSPCTMKITEDDELLDLAVKSGCRGLLIGFESVSQNTLKSMGKGFNYAERYKDQVKKLHDNGISIQACFVFGFDMDDKSVFKKTVEMVDKLKLDLPRYTVYTPFPGTPVYKKLEVENRIIEKDWSLYDAQHVVFRPALMTPEELQQGSYWAWRQSYSAGSIIKRLSGSPNIFPYGIPSNIAYKIYAKGLPNYSRERMANQDSLN
ncbi:MAG: radical SAM protein [Candidatus Omnitrophota bacterium]